MLNTLTYPLTLTVQESTAEHLELSRLLAAATVNPEFENLLLNEPQLALQAGYQDETFHLSPEESDLILSVRAGSLAELAGILVRTLGERQYLRCHAPALEEKVLLN